MNETITESYQYRFHGIERLYGQGSLLKIQKLHIAVIGIGGVGSWACESLARSGVGSITIIDLDDICFSNINRQIHATTQTVGKTKIEVMRERILDINPECQVYMINSFYSEKSTESILETKYDYIIDAFDDGRLKAHLIAECLKRKQKLLVTGAAGAKLRPEYIKIADISHTYEDALLFNVRRELKRKYKRLKLMNHGKRKKLGIPAVFSSEPMIQTEPCKPGKKLNCHSGLGSASFITATFAYHAVAYIMNELILPTPKAHA